VDVTCRFNISEGVLASKLWDATTEHLFDSHGTPVDRGIAGKFEVIEQVALPVF
jgi:hypothetical protein